MFALVANYVPLVCLQEKTTQNFREMLTITNLLSILNR